MKRISQITIDDETGIAIVIAACLALLGGLMLVGGCAMPGVDNHHGIFSAPDKNLETGAYEDRH